MTQEEGLVYVGKILDIEDIAGADFIVSAQVYHGVGSGWRGVVKKGDFQEGSKCIVYLPDALLPETEEMSFMKKHSFRVKMCKFRGAPSEVLIMPMWTGELEALDIGTDVTGIAEVKRYHKPFPFDLQGTVKESFPSFIPKTDEPNYQRVYHLVNELWGQPYYITEKLDGSSTTAFRYKGEFGVCSRNWQIEAGEKNAYWQVAEKYKLQESLPEGIALQWETCGPKIQGNPMDLREIEGFLFSAYDIAERRYLEMQELIDISQVLQFPMVKILEQGNYFDASRIEHLGEGVYENGLEREGVVVRSRWNHDNRAPISFKVINLNYEGSRDGKR